MTTHEEMPRNLKPYKGLRVRFRTLLKAGNAFKYSTKMYGRHDQAILLIQLKKGNLDEFENLIKQATNNDCLFEGIPVEVDRWNK